MSICVHYDKKKRKCNKDGIGCKLRDSSSGCFKHGQLEEKDDDFRLNPVDRIAPW